MMIDDKENIKKSSRRPSNLNEILASQNNLNLNNDLAIINNTYRSSALSEFDKGEKQSSDFSDDNNININNMERI